MHNVPYEILCFGDSNTWGYSPETQERFAREVRWPGILRRELGPDVVVIEEGQNGRTTVWDDPVEGHKNGREYLIPCLESHSPLDLVILMLGTNDLKKRFSVPAFDIGWSIRSLLEIIARSGAGRGGDPPGTLLLCPPPLGRLTEWAELFEDGQATSRGLARHYAEAAREYRCDFVDAGAVTAVSDVDGIHLDARGHEALGRAVAAEVRKLRAPDRTDA
jgi:lysophospholipase L1-like esterase